MEYEERYKGRRVKIVTKQSGDRTWCSWAELLDSSEPALKVDSSSSEEHAHSAALSAAMAKVDRLRERIGKP
jgi:hypothetical protein